MARAADMMGVGFSAPQALLVGNNVVGKTAVGTALSGGAAIGSQDNVVVVTTGASDTSVVLPAVGIGAGPYVVFNTSATTALVYPQSGETIDNGSTSASVSVAQNKTRMFWKITATGWASLLTA